MEGLYKQVDRITYPIPATSDIMLPMAAAKKRKKSLDQHNSLVFLWSIV